MPFALELTHPNGDQRVELVALRTLTLYVNGYRARYRPMGRGTPQALIFDDGQPRDQGLPFFISGNVQSPEVNGVRIARGHLKHGDVVRWGDYQLTVFEVRPPDPTEWAMVDAARADDAALEVYADWLETGGATHKAEWARLVLSPKSERMNALAANLGGSFRALVARGPIERCAERSCAQRWEKLTLRAEPCVRDCSVCKRAVTWCEDSETARAVAGPVTLDPATPHTPRDLLPVPVPVG